MPSSANPYTWVEGKDSCSLCLAWIWADLGYGIKSFPQDSSDSGRSGLLFTSLRNLRRQRPFWCGWEGLDQVRHRKSEKILKNLPHWRQEHLELPVAPPTPFRRLSPHSELTSLLFPFQDEILSQECIISCDPSISLRWALLSVCTDEVSEAQRGE